MISGITPFTEEFKDNVIKLILPIQREEFGINITQEDQPDLMNIPNFYQQGKGNFWLARDNNQVVGTVSLKDIGNDNVALRKMFVHSDYRGKEKGVSQKLMDTAVRWAQEQKVLHIYLGTTPEFLAAHRFYEKNGFAEIGREELPEGFPVMDVDKKFYRLAL